MLDTQQIVFIVVGIIVLFISFYIGYKWYHSYRYQSNNELVNHPNWFINFWQKNKTAMYFLLLVILVILGLVLILQGCGIDLGIKKD